MSHKVTHSVLTKVRGPVYDYIVSVSGKGISVTNKINRWRRSWDELDILFREAKQ